MTITKINNNLFKYGVILAAAFSLSLAACILPPIQWIVREATLAAFMTEANPWIVSQDISNPLLHSILLSTLDIFISTVLLGLFIIPSMLIIVKILDYWKPQWLPIEDKLLLTPIKYWYHISILIFATYTCGSFLGKLLNL